MKLAGAWCFQGSWGYSLNQTSAKGPGKAAGAHRAWIWSELSRRVLGGEDGAELWEVALQGVLRLLELVIRSARVL